MPNSVKGSNNPNPNSPTQSPQPSQSGAFSKHHLSSSKNLKAAIKKKDSQQVQQLLMSERFSLVTISELKYFAMIYCHDSYEINRMLEQYYSFHANLLTDSLETMQQKVRQNPRMLICSRNLDGLNPIQFLKEHKARLIRNFGRIEQNTQAQLCQDKINAINIIMIESIPKQEPKPTRPHPITPPASPQSLSRK